MQLVAALLQSICLDNRLAYTTHTKHTLVEWANQNYIITWVDKAFKGDYALRGRASWGLACKWYGAGSGSTAIVAPYRTPTSGAAAGSTCICTPCGRTGTQIATWIHPLKLGLPFKQNRIIQCCLLASVRLAVSLITTQPNILANFNPTDWYTVDGFVLRTTFNVV